MRNRMQDLDFEQTVAFDSVKDFEFTKKAAQKFRQIVSLDSFEDEDADVIFHYLYKEMELVSFGDYLKRYVYERAELEEPFSQVPQEVYKEIVVESFKETYTPKSMSPTSAKLSSLVNNWLTQASVKRETVFLLGFGLRMSTEDVSDFLTRVLREQDFDFHNPEEVIYWYCYKNHLGYYKAEEYKEIYKNHLAPVEKKAGEVVYGTGLCLDSEEKLLEYAALAECSSSHPISKSLQKAYGKPIDRNRVTDIEEISGNGVIAKVDGISVAAGNTKLMNRLGIAYQDCHHVGTVVHMAIDGKYAGHILISDIIKPHAKEAIAELKKAGISKTVMLTGDSKRVADQVAEELGIQEVYSELLPADKVSRVEELLNQKSEKDKLAFVGDGINDAPVLSRADIGIAMGALGSDAAIEAADIVLMDDDPLKISKAIKIARKCIRIVYENIYFAIGIKVLCLILGALGIANMWMAIFADVGVMIIAVLNAIRTLFVKNL